MFLATLIWRWQLTVTPLDYRVQLLFQLTYPGPELRLVPRHLMGVRNDAICEKCVPGGRHFFVPMMLPNW